MVHITSRRHDVRRTPDVEVKAYTNTPTATLLLDGVELGTAPVNDRIARWKLRLHPGLNRIEVRTSAGSDSVAWRYSPAPAMVPTAD